MPGKNSQQNNSVEKTATLIDSKARGGIIALDGFDFQRNYALVLMIESLANPDFRALLVEGAEDVETGSIAEGITERVSIQVKNHRVTTAEAREIIANFFKLDKDPPDTWSSFVIVCTALGDETSAIHAGLERFREISKSGFYDQEKHIVADTRAQLVETINKAGLPAEFVIERVTFQPDLNVYQKDDWVQSRALDLLRQQYPQVDNEGLEIIYLRLADMVRKFTGRAILRQQVEELIKVELEKHPYARLSGALPPPSLCLSRATRISSGARRIWRSCMACCNQEKRWVYARQC